MKSGDTEESAAQRALDQLRRVRARIAGAVLNAVSAKNDPQYSYYSSHYGQDPPSRSRIRTPASKSHQHRPVNRARTTLRPAISGALAIKGVRGDAETVVDSLLSKAAAHEPSTA